MIIFADKLHFTCNVCHTISTFDSLHSKPNTSEVTFYCFKCLRHRSIFDIKVFHRYNDFRSIMSMVPLYLIDTKEFDSKTWHDISKMYTSVDEAVQVAAVLSRKGQYTRVRGSDKTIITEF